MPPRQASGPVEQVPATLSDGAPGTGDAGAAPAGRRSWRARLAEAFLMVAGYTLVAVWATWPLAVRPLGGLYGFPNDNWGGIWVYGWLHDAYLGDVSGERSPALQAPFGYPLPDQALQPMDRLMSLLFGGAEQGLGAYNAHIFLSFILAGCTMYLLARHITGSRAAAAVAGFAYTFSPFHLALAMQYNALAAIEWIPLYLLALIVLLRRGRKRDAALAGGAFALVAITSYYYAWFTAWATLAIVAAFVARLAWPWLRRGAEGGRARAAGRLAGLVASRGAIAVGVALAIVVPLVVPSLQAAAEDDVSRATTHPISEAVRYSARPWMLVLPPHDNPLAPESLRTFVTARLYDSPVYEQAIYLGLGVLALAVIGLWRRTSPWLAPPPPPSRGARLLLGAGVAVGLLIMLGPYVPLETGYWSQWSVVDATRHLPSLGALMFDLAPQFRFFVRAFVIVSACLAVLAAIGFARLERSLGAGQPWARAGLATVAVLVIGAEFTNSPPHVFWSDREPAWVGAVAALPADARIVDYPLATASSPRSLYYIFWQTRHARATVNPAQSDEALALSGAIASPDSAASGRALRQAGIDYAVVHTDLPPLTTPPYQPALPDDALPADTGAFNPWLRRVARTDDAVLYRVLREPRAGRAAVARVGAGFGPAEPEAGAEAWWVQGSTAQIALEVSGDPRPLLLQLELASYARPRTVAVSLDDRPAPPFVVSEVYRTYRIPLGRLAAGGHVVALTPRPGPEAIGNGDARAVSLRLREIRVVAAPGRSG